MVYIYIWYIYGIYIYGIYIYGIYGIPIIICHKSG